MTNSDEVWKQFMHSKNIIYCLKYVVGGLYLLTVSDMLMISHIS